MDISYQKNLHKSYMCIESTEDMENFIEEHEVMILQKYRIPQLLPMQIMIQDGKVQYWFEITGKQPLVEYLEGKQIGTQQLKKVLLSIEQICRKLPEFLLKEDRICLQENLLYVDLREEKVYFTYLPFWQGSFLQEFRSWMEEVLKHIEHHDRECLELAYHVYEKSREENISMVELLKEMRTEPFFEKHGERKRAEPEEECLMSEKNQKNIFKDKEQEILMEVKKYIKEWFGECLGGWKKKETREVRRNKHKKVRRGIIEEKQIKTPNRSEPGNEFKAKKQQKDESRKYHTQLLCAESNQFKGRLLYQGENGCSSFGVVGTEYVIGRNSAQVDGKIETDGISRVHARIIKRAGDYYIEDLNSTNGTYLNGERLEYHQSRKLDRNDRIRFGIEEYVFY